MWHGALQIREHQGDYYHNQRNARIMASLVDFQGREAFDRGGAVAWGGPPAKEMCLHPASPLHRGITAKGMQRQPPGLSPPG